MERIELIHVNKKLGGKEVLKGVDLTLEEGKLYGIIGENGSGKTMLLRLLAGLIHPDDGEVHYGGKKVKKLTQVVNIGLSIENIGLYDDRRDASENGINRPKEHEICKVVAGLKTEGSVSAGNFIKPGSFAA